jgi:4'-phosphopantetheinyl transferase
MPIHFNKQPLPHLRIATWLLTETEEELYTLAGSRFEDDPLIQQSGSRMRLQRLAVRILLLRLGGNARLRYDSAGKPFLEGTDAHISVSHCNEIAAVSINDLTETGIDIEIIKPRIIGIAEKFMSAEELKSVGPGEQATDILHIYWCAKEALYKLYGRKEVIFKENLVINPFSYERDSGTLSGIIRINDMNTPYILCYEKMKEHMLVYVLNS